MIDLPRLIACGINPTAARAFADPLAIACVQFDIASIEQQAAFIAQAAHESAMLTHLEESLWYSTPQNIVRAFDRLRVLGPDALAGLCKNPRALAVAAYSKVNGNGDASTTDGWDYRGGGLFQLTGRAVYRQAGQALGEPYEQQPELVRSPGADAALTAAWFWKGHGCNELIARGDFDGTTRRINGGMNGAAERRALYATCLEAIQPAGAMQ